MLIGLTLAWSAGRAQQDTLAGMRLFLRICNDYKQLPVQLDLEISHSANLIRRPADSQQVEARFFLAAAGSYIEMQGVEQVVNDSLLLLVNKPGKRMIVYANRQSVASRLQQYLGMGMKDSSLAKIAGRYVTGMEPGGSADTGVLILRSRTNVYLTSLPAEEIRVQYHPGTFRPYEVRSLTRSLVKIDATVYPTYAAQPEWAGKLVIDSRDSAYSLVKEQTTAFRYRKITHDKSPVLPVQVSDRIVAGTNGRYRPVQPYEDYSLTEQF